MYLFVYSRRLTFESKQAVFDKSKNIGAHENSISHVFVLTSTRKLQRETGIT